MHVIEDDLVLHYYGELPSPDEGRVSAHLADCRECHAAYRRLQQVLMSVDDKALGVPELPDGFERTVWARLEPGLQRERAGWFARRLPSPSRLGWAAAAVVIVVSAFYAGRFSRSPQTPGSTPPAAVVAAAANQNQVRERILLVDLGDHLDRSQRILVELVTAEGAGSNLAGERDRAEQLVWANRLYRETAAATGDSSIVDLLDQLERVLVEVAASPANPSQRELEDVRRRIESGSLLFKVRIVSSDLQ
jgi:hypothetical protein